MDPVTTSASPGGSFPSGKAERISHDLAKGLEAGEIDAWKWRAGEFSVSPLSGDRPVDEGLPLCPPCESILARGGKTAADGRSLGSSY